MALATDPPRLLFISHAEKDAAYLSELEKHLAPLVRRHLIEPWHAGKIGPGQVYREETAAHLARAELILILVSSDYVAADDLYQDELQQALLRHEQGSVRVIPITLRPVHQPGSTLARLQALPRGGQPVSQWADRDAAWSQVAAEIEAAVASLPSRGPSPPPPSPPPRAATLIIPKAGDAAAPEPTGADLLPGSVLLDKYRITKEIGRGGMGRVLLAERARIGGHVAIKVLLPEFSRSPEMARRFFNEAVAVNAVGHPGLVQVFDHGQLGDGSAFLVMEYLDGESLGALLRGAPFALRQTAAQTGFQLASILAAVHARGIVHRDLKPDNVVAVRDSSAAGGRRLKVLDFGIAKVARENSLAMPPQAAQPTKAGAMMGTPAYMSPEQCRDSGSVSDKTDVYALGVMLYQFVAGEVPFADPDWMAVVTRQITEEPRPLAKVAPQADRALAALVGRMLDKDPLRRPTMAQVAAALAPAPDKETGKETGPAPDKETRRWAVLAVAGVGAAAGLAMLLGSKVDRPVQTERTTPPAQDPLDTPIWARNKPDGGAAQPPESVPIWERHKPSP